MENEIGPSENKVILGEKKSFINLLKKADSGVKKREIETLVRYHINKTFYGVTFPEDIEDRMRKIYRKIEKDREIFEQ